MEKLVASKQQIKESESLLKTSREQEQRKIVAAEQLIEVARNRRRPENKGFSPVRTGSEHAYKLEGNTEWRNKEKKKKQGGDALEKKINKRANEIIENLLPDKKKKME